MTLSTRHDRVAPVRDGTCCDGCDMAPPPPCDEAGLVEGGQGRDDLSMIVASDIVAWVTVAAMVVGLIVYAASGGAS